jgi:hypothetical protein
MFRRASVPQTSLHPEDGGSTFFRNVGIHTAAQPGRPQLEWLLLVRESPSLTSQKEKEGKTDKKERNKKNRREENRFKVTR